MCMYIKNKPKITETPILVFKWGSVFYCNDNKFKSASYDFIYEKNQKYHSTISQSNYTVEEGFHSIKTLSDFTNSDYYKFLGSVLFIGVFLIPKGATIIEGFDDDEYGIECYVSNEIIYLGEYDESTYEELKKTYLIL